MGGETAVSASSQANTGLKKKTTQHNTTTKQQVALACLTALLLTLIDQWGRRMHDQGLPTVIAIT